jgi:hypothetical protein
MSVIGANGLPMCVMKPSRSARLPDPPIFLVGCQEIEDLEAVHVGHVEIEDNQVDGANGEPFDRLEARRRFDEIERTRDSASDALTLRRIVGASSTMRTRVMLMAVRPRAEANSDYIAWTCVSLPRGEWLSLDRGSNWE